MEKELRKRKKSVSFKEDVDVYILQDNAYGDYKRARQNEFYLDKIRFMARIKCMETMLTPIMLRKKNCYS